MSSIDDLLNSSLDSIDDLPSVAAWPIGAHLCKFTVEVNTKNAKSPMILARAELISTEEQADPEATPAKPGDKYTFSYGLKKKDGTKNEFSIQLMKKDLAQPLINAGVISEAALMSEVVEAYKDGVEMLITTGHREYNGEMQMTLRTSEVAA